MTARIALAMASLVAVAVLPGTGTTAPREGLIAFEGDYSIYLVKPDGSSLRVLARRGETDPGGEGDGYLVYPSFTTDGSRVTYLNGLRTTHQSVVVNRAAGGTPKLFRVDGYLLASPLSFSPDGRFAAVSRFYGERAGELALYIAATRSSRDDVQLTGNPLPRRLARDKRPDWSPDGRSIAFAREQGREVSLMVVPALGGSARRLVRGAEPDWAPNGQRIAFVRRDGVYHCRPDGTGVRRIVAANRSGSPDYSPDGNRIAYTAGGSVWVVSSSGGVPVKIADGVSGQLDWG
jgi:Tol biopolymer transport system component